MLNKKTVCIVLFYLFLTSYSYAEVSHNTLAVLVNINDPESLEIARYYQQARNIPEQNIIFLSFRRNAKSLSKVEFEIVEAQLHKKVSADIQAYVLAWRKPWRVDCMSITSAFSLGFDKGYCAKGCKTTRSVAYYNSFGDTPFNDFEIRPSMMLSANSVQGVKELIDRGVSSDYTRPEGSAYLLSTSDKQRNVRARMFAKIKSAFSDLINVNIVNSNTLKNKTDVMFYFTGLAKVNKVNQNKYLPGAIADHLTSVGGKLFSSSQMSILKWIDAGVTGTYGTVIEPCNFVEKFSNPGVLMQHYLSGSTLLEVYWKSVKMPGQGVFVGEPLASPYKGCTLSSKTFQYIDKLPENYIERQSRNCS